MNQVRVVKCCMVSWCLLTAVLSRCTRQEPVTTSQSGVIECIWTTHKRAAKGPLPTSCHVTCPTSFQWRKHVHLVDSSPTDLRALWEAMVRSRTSMASDPFLCLVESIPRRINAVSRARGRGVTCYKIEGTAGEIRARRAAIRDGRAVCAVRSGPGAGRKWSQRRSLDRASAQRRHRRPGVNAQGADIIPAYTLCRISGAWLSAHSPARKSTGAQAAGNQDDPYGPPIARLLASHQGEQGSIPDEVTPPFSQMGTVPDDTTRWRVILGELQFSPPLHSEAAPHSARFTLVGSQDLDVSRAAQISALRCPLKRHWTPQPDSAGSATIKRTVSAALRPGNLADSFGNKPDSTILCAFEHQLVADWLLLQFNPRPAYLPSRSRLIWGAGGSGFESRISRKPAKSLQANDRRIPYNRSWHIKDSDWLAHEVHCRGVEPWLRDSPGLAPGQAAAAPSAFESPTVSSLALVAPSTLLTPPRVFVVVMDSDWSQRRKVRHIASPRPCHDVVGDVWIPAILPLHNSSCQAQCAVANQERELFPVPRAANRSVGQHTSHEPPRPFVSLHMSCDFDKQLPCSESTASSGTIPRCESPEWPGRGLSPDRFGGRRADKAAQPPCPPPSLVRPVDVCMYVYHRYLRLQWAQEHTRWSAARQYVVFSDEFLLDLDDNDGSRRIRLYQAISPPRPSIPLASDLGAIESIVARFLARVEHVPCRQSRDELPSLPVDQTPSHHGGRRHKRCAAAPRGTVGRPAEARSETNTRSVTTRTMGTKQAMVITFTKLETADKDDNNPFRKAPPPSEDNDNGTEGIPDRLGPDSSNSVKFRCIFGFMGAKWGAGAHFGIHSILSWVSGDIPAKFGRDPITGWSSSGMQGRGKRENLEKTRRPEASSGAIPTGTNPGATPPGIEPDTPWWEARSLSTTPPRAQAVQEKPYKGGIRRSYRHFCSTRQRLQPGVSDAWRRIRGDSGRLSILEEIWKEFSPGYDPAWSCINGPVVNHLSDFKQIVTYLSRYDNFVNSFRDKIDVKHIYSKVTLAIGAQFTRPALHASETIGDLQGNTLRILYLPGVGQQPMNTQLKLQRGYHLPPPPGPLKYHDWGCASVVGRLLASHLGDLGSIPGGIAPGFLHVGNVSHDAAGQRVPSGVSRFPQLCIPALLYTHLASPSSDLKTSMLRAASSLTTTSRRLLQWTVSGRNSGSSLILVASRNYGDGLLSRARSLVLPRETSGARAVPQTKHNRTAIPYNSPFLPPPPPPTPARSRPLGGLQGASCHSTPLQPTVEGKRWEVCWPGLIRVHVGSPKVISQPVRVIEVSTEQFRNERAAEAGDPRINEKTRRPVASSGTIPTCENLEVALSGVEPGSSRWEASGLTAQPPWPLVVLGVCRLRENLPRVTTTRFLQNIDYLSLPRPFLYMAQVMNASHFPPCVFKCLALPPSGVSTHGHVSTSFSTLAAQPGCYQYRTLVPSPPLQPAITTPLTSPTTPTSPPPLPYKSCSHNHHLGEAVGLPLNTVEYVVAGHNDAAIEGTRPLDWKLVWPSKRLQFASRSTACSIECVSNINDFAALGCSASGLSWQPTCFLFLPMSMDPLLPRMRVELLSHWSLATWLDYSPTTSGNRVRFLVGPPLVFRIWESCRTMPLLPSGGAPSSLCFIRIGSEDLDARSCPNFLIHSLFSPSILLAESVDRRRAIIKSVSRLLVDLRLSDTSCRPQNQQQTLSTLVAPLHVAGSNREIWVAPNTKVLRTNEGEAIAGMRGRGKREISEKTRRPAEKSDTIPTCENPGATPPGIKPGSPWWKASSLATTPPRPLTLIRKEGKKTFT
ncbi:hypothetical protein PR048_027703 [Dryococelus australis]|uniref:Uncharacterized protein n=1 Tax=Dryococelus australis TaxID=614101 RepID=A0ABQ9GH78_9NEOP|nr:hypothetical protein PR048_027703 [Dryococelus australis]